MQTNNITIKLCKISSAGTSDNCVTWPVEEMLNTDNKKVAWVQHANHSAKATHNRKLLFSMSSLSQNDQQNAAGCSPNCRTKKQP